MLYKNVYLYSFFSIQTTVTNKDRRTDAHIRMAKNVFICCSDPTQTSQKLVKSLEIQTPELPSSTLSPSIKTTINLKAKTRTNKVQSPSLSVAANRSLQFFLTTRFIVSIAVPRDRQLNLRTIYQEHENRKYDIDNPDNLVDTLLLEDTKEENPSAQSNEFPLSELDWIHRK